jgi:hypothetical protein
MAFREKYTKFLNDSFRHQFLQQNSRFMNDESLQLKQYARYVCDSQILNRSKEHEKDKNASYGFSPINFLCAIHQDGSMSKMLFEFKIVNHFLKDKDGDRAVEVVECMLIDLLKNCKTIKTFDIDIIDAELKKIEDEYLKSQSENASSENTEETKDNEH